MFAIEDIAKDPMVHRIAQDFSMSIHFRQNDRTIEIEIVSHHHVARGVRLIESGERFGDGYTSCVACFARDARDFGNFRRNVHRGVHAHIGIVGFFDTLGRQIPYHVTQLDDMGELIERRG